jgi:hypothetical protein
MIRRVRRAWGVLAALAAPAVVGSAACGLTAVGSGLTGESGDSGDAAVTTGAEGGAPPGDAAPDADGSDTTNVGVDAAVPDVRDDAGCPTGRGPNMLRLFGGGSPALCIDETEVSARQYKPFVAAFAAGATPPQTAECAANASVVPVDMSTSAMPSLDADDPVDRIDRCDAQLYCAWAGKHLCGRRDGTDKFIASGNAEDAQIGEWYAACSQDGMTSSVPATCNLLANTGIAGRNADGQVLVSADPPGGFTYPVGLLHHIVGNVEEWADGCDDAGSCVARGASVATSSGNTDCTTRTTHPRMDRRADLGFRCCANPTP